MGVITYLRNSNVVHVYEFVLRLMLKRSYQTTKKSKMIQYYVCFNHVLYFIMYSCGLY